MFNNPLKFKKNAQFSKKISCLLLFIILWQTVFAPLIVLAQTTPQEFSEVKIADVGCGIKVGCYVTRGLAWLGYRILQGVSVFLWLASKVFDLSADLSLNYQSYHKNTAPAVYSGWKITRDFFNIFFIFIILVMAIGTILQITGYGFKELMFRLVAVAIFINFSFFITQQVITVANSAAWYFKKQSVAGFGDSFAKLLNPQQLIGGYQLNQISAEQIAEISPQIIAQLDPIKTPQELAEFIQKITYTVENLPKPCLPGPPLPGERIAPPLEKNLEACKQELKVILQNPQQKQRQAAQIVQSFNRSDDSQIVSILIATLGGIAIILTAAFILFAAGILLIFRTAVLWILMILAPFAFISEILPKTRGYARSWWERLFKEAFFAPAMMFMFFLAMKIIANEPLKKAGFPEETSSMGASLVFNYYLMTKYSVILILMALSLGIARSLGATGAGMMIKWGNTAKDWTLGKAGKIAQSPFYGAAREARRLAAPAAESLATGEGRGARFLRRIPGVGAGARAMVTSERQRVSDVEKQIGNLTTNEIKGRYESKWLKTREDLMAMTNVLKGRGDLSKLGDDNLKEVHGRMKGLGMDTKDIETYVPSLAGKAAAEEARKKGLTTTQQAAAATQATEKAINSQSADKMGSYAKNTAEFQDSNNQTIMQKRYGENYLRELDKAADVDDNVKNSAKALFESFAELKDAGGVNTVQTLEDMADALERLGNTSAAKFLKTAEGENVFRKYVKDPTNPVNDRFASMRRLDLANQTQMTNYQKIYDEQGLKNMEREAGVNVKTKESMRALFESFTNLQDASGTTVSTIEEMADALERMGNVSAAKFLRTAEGEDMFRRNAKDATGHDISGQYASMRKLDIAGSNQLTKIIPKFTPQNIHDVDFDGLNDIQRQAVASHMVQNFNKNQVAAVAGKGGKILNDFLNELKNNVNPASPHTVTTADITNWYTAQGNNSVASYFRSSAGRALLGPPSPPPPPPPSPSP